jgi:sensor histidine kinase YesM
MRPWMLVSAAWILPAIFAAVNRYMQTHLRGWDPVTARDLIWESGDWFLYAFLTPGVFAISRRWPLVRPHILRRTLLHLAISLLFCVAWATCGQVFRLLLLIVFEHQAFVTAVAKGAQFWGSLGIEWLSWIFTTLPFGVAVYLCVVGTEHAIRYFTEAREHEVQLARLSEQLAGARFAALQAQVNPHFLFNALNTIAVLVRDNERESAVNIVEHLSEVLRSTLSRHSVNEVPLGDELELVRQYLAIEQARFSDRLRPEFNVAESLSAAAVPSFALQHLVENAIRHGIARRTEAGMLRIEGRRDGEMLELAVIDDGPGVEIDIASPPGHGIENTRERLRVLYGEEASLLIKRRPEGGTIATLRVPYRDIVLEIADDSR